MPSNDYGEMRRTPGFNINVGYAVMLAIGVAAAGAWIGASVHSDVATARAQDATWNVTGPPCPQISAAWFKVLQIEPESFAFQGIQGVRAHGNVECTTVDHDGSRPTKDFPVCQFTAPFALSMTTPAGQVFYEPGSGQPATVSIQDGKLRCVMGAGETRPTNWLQPANSPKRSAAL